MPYGITVLPATRQRWESRLYPQPKQVLDLATPEGCKAELTYVTWKQTGLELNPRPVNRKSNALPLSHHSGVFDLIRKGDYHALVWKANWSFE